MTEIFALSDGERAAIIAGLFAIGAGVPGAIAAVISARTRKENTSQHGESQKKLEEVRDAVTGQGVKIDEVRDDVKHIGEKVDEHSELLARHDERLRAFDSSDVDRHPIL